VDRLFAKSHLHGVTLLVALGCLWGIGSGTALAQFHLPKIPKLPKKESKPAAPATKEVGASNAATLEVSLIAPDSAPPGGTGELTITGKGFAKDSAIGFNCPHGQFSLENIQVVTPTKMTGTIHVPLDTEEGPCGVNGANLAKGGAPFRISNSSPLPVAVAAGYIGEGDMDFMQMMMKFQQVAMKNAQGSWQSGSNSGQAPPPDELHLTPSTISFYSAGQKIFEEPVSGVKNLGEMSQGGHPIGIFRIVFNDGKIYNFAGKVENSGDATYLYLKQKLGK
jgi:hypothetical protein